MDFNKFKKPDKKLCMRAIIHGWPDACEEILMDAVNEYGYGGVVTNPEQSNGYTGKKENIETFFDLTQKLKEKDLKYWIYDEKGYPSGYADGMTLQENPELEAKGFYMVRKIAYEPRSVHFVLDEESDRIIWAAKYPIEGDSRQISPISYEEMEAVPFTDRECKCDMKEREVMFVFCIKSAYEGSQCTHNTCSFSRYINIMDEKAVRKYIDVAYEPIAASAPKAYQEAEAVFTDEPSLMTAYAQGEEVWPYALAPWVDGLFEEFEKEYQYSILPYLPLIFEGTECAAFVRVDFYNLVGKIIARAYTGQIAEWCRNNGGRFSGHYMAEEYVMFHVLYYGSYIEMLKAADYPGIDVLASRPEIYNYNTAKFSQMVARKKGTDGLMVELCPFVDREEFDKNPYFHTVGMLGLLFLGGCRQVNSYYSSDFSLYNPEKLAGFTGYMTQEEAVKLNEYVGRLHYVMKDKINISGTFVYYPLEDAQAKLRPKHSAILAPCGSTDESLLSLTRTIYENGHDYLMADRDDIVTAGNTLFGKVPEISGIPVKNILIPRMDVIHEDVKKALLHLKKAGVCVYFTDYLPAHTAQERVKFEQYISKGAAMLDYNIREDEDFRAYTVDEILHELNNQPQEFYVMEKGVNKSKILKAKYCVSAKEVYFVLNASNTATEIKWEHNLKREAEIWDPWEGTRCKAGKTVELDSYRGKFWVFER